MPTKRPLLAMPFLGTIRERNNGALTGNEDVKDFKVTVSSTSDLKNPSRNRWFTKEVLFWILLSFAAVQIASAQQNEHAAVDFTSSVVMVGLFKVKNWLSRSVLAFMLLITNVFSILTMDSNVTKAARIGLIKFGCGALAFAIITFVTKFKLNTRYNVYIYCSATSFSGLCAALLLISERSQVLTFENYAKEFYFYVTNISAWSILLLQIRQDQFSRARRFVRDTPRTILFFISLTYVASLALPFIAIFIPIEIEECIHMCIIVYTTICSGSFGVSINLAIQWIMSLIVDQSCPLLATGNDRMYQIRRLDYYLLLASIATSGSFKELETLIGIIEKQNISLATNLRNVETFLDQENHARETEREFDKELLAAYGAQLDIISRNRSMSDIINPIMLLNALACDIVYLIQLKSFEKHEYDEPIAILLHQEFSEFAALARIAFANCNATYDFLTTINTAEVVQINIDLFQNLLLHLMIGMAYITVYSFLT